ncbi:MAG TPA: hypothetical protein VJ857_05515 [Methanocorpusculum sp.]|nr:hypothetical protein [Methanocorpusculum sp.]HJJ49927.1 hypothetical protein [Methanocorpusculum sp.]HKL98106.1 hypothetical protein [Methanocorpusculum sp.]
MNIKLLGGVFAVLLACVCVAGCIGNSTPTETAPDALVGTWVGVENGLLVSYNMNLVCNEDGSAKLTGSFSGGGMSKNLNANLNWDYVSGNQYVGKSGDNSLAIYLTGNTLTITVNPKKMGIADFDIDYDINMKRSSGTVSTTTVTKTPTALPTTTPPDAVVGSWKGTEEGVVSYDLTMVYKADRTGMITGTFVVMGQSKSFTKDVTWEYVNENKYQAKYGSEILPLQLVGTELIVTLVPSKLGVEGMDNPLSIPTSKI